MFERTRYTKYENLKKELENNESPDKEMYKLMKDNKQSNKVNILVDEGVELKDEKEINISIHKNFIKKYKKKDNSDVEKQKEEIESFCEKHKITIPKITSEERKKLEDDISPEIVQIALRDLNKESAGGDDDVPTKLICDLFESIPKSLSKIVVNEINNRKGMENRNKNSKLMMRKIIILKKRTKKKDHSQLCPITILSTFYKLMSKIVNIMLNNAINEVMPGNIAAYRAENCPNRCARYINDAKDLLLEMKIKQKHCNSILVVHMTMQGETTYMLC